MNSSFVGSLPRTTYRAIVCDDESYIANSTAMLLKMQPDWELDVTVCTSPVACMERIQKGRADLLVVDICMPGISGLEVMRITTELWPMCQIVLLTAHPQFDYVYDAIQHDNVSYVLKCDGHQALITAVARAVHRLDSAARQARVYDTAKAQVKSALPYLQREYFLDLIHGVFYEQAQMERVRRELSLPMDLNRPFSGWLMLMQVYQDTFLERNQRTQLLLSALKQYLPKEARFVSVPLDSQRTLCLVQTESEGAFPPGQLEGMLESLQQAALTQMGLPFSCVYCQDIRNASFLPQCYEDMSLRQTSMAVGQEEMWLVEVSKEPGQRPPLLDGQCVTNARLWRHAFENGDPAADGMLNALLKKLGSASSIMEPPAMEMYLQIALQIVQILRNGNITQLGPGVCVQGLMRVDLHLSPGAAADYLTRVVHAIRENRKESSVTSAQETIDKVTSYINSHLSQDISLSCLADTLHVNASYLSRMFRKATGETLMGYLTQVKMNHAYTLLQDHAVRVHKVSQALGFLTPAYFSYFFKKNAGCTPSEYRERHGK